MLKGLVIVLLLVFSSSFPFSPVYGQDGPVISEFMASNSSILQDEDGEYSDWIEIYNTSDEETNLYGWFLTDDEDLLTKWSFPGIMIEAHEYLLIFASGKDRKLEKDKLHTNFKLGSSGEFLALVKPGGSVYATVFNPEYPEQYEDISYGLFLENYIYLGTPTPGAENTNNNPFVPLPEFSVGHNHFYSPFQLELSSGSDGTAIYYTADASTPSADHGINYTEPINISATTVIRAIAVKDGTTSKTKTQSYLFPDDIIRQPMYPPGYPAEWLQPVDGTDEHIPIESDYGMHQNVVDHATVSPVIIRSLLDLPVVSIVSDIDNFFSTSTDPDSGGIYMYTGAPDGPTINLQYHLGHGWVRPASVEYFNSSDGSVDFQINCGIELHGGASRTPWKTAKHSFTLEFKSEYGPSKLRQNIFGEGTPDQFDNLILRGGFATRYGLEILDPWTKSTFREMGRYAAYSQFVHLYLNGMYWGIYNLCEQMDDNCMRDHFGGNEEDYDIIKDYYEVEAGDTIAWSNLVAMVKDNITDTTNYQRLLGNNPDGTPNASYDKMIDAENLADYILLNFYAGNTDWDHHNWMAARSRVNSDGFRFLPWDNEYVLGSVYENVTGRNNENRPSGIFQDLMINNQFKTLFIDRVNRHFFNGGALTPEPCHYGYTRWWETIDTAIVSESARWNSASQPKNDIWERSYHSFINTYFPIRTEIVFKQLIARGMYPTIEPPEFNTENTTLPGDFKLYMTAASGGDILYTINGIDPGYANENLQNSVILYDGNAMPLITDTMFIRARVMNEGSWSKLVSKRFIIDQPIYHETGFPLTEKAGLRSYPNPARDFITISYTLSYHSFFRLTLYNFIGELIATLDTGSKEAGVYSIRWATGHLPTGSYICVLEDLIHAAWYHISIVIE